MFFRIIIVAVVRTAVAPGPVLACCAGFISLCQVFPEAPEAILPDILQPVMQDIPLHEFRTAVVKGLHTQESLVETAKWIMGAKEYYLQQFQDSGDLIDAGGLSSFSKEEMHAFADAVAPYIPGVRIRGV